MRCLRAWVMAKSTLGTPASMPKSLEWATWRYTAAVSRNALAGMQPRTRHVPPNVSISTTAQLRPAEAPYSAAAYPPGPPPITTRSNCSAVGTTSNASLTPRGTSPRCAYEANWLPAGTESDAGPQPSVGTHCLSSHWT